MTGRVFWLAVLAGGFVAGVLDIVYAFVSAGMSGRTPVRVLQAVASGWLGRAAFTGGVPAAMLGLASHMGISIAAAAIFGLAFRGTPWMRARWIASGVAFGVLVYLFMNFVVIPLSAAPFGACTSSVQEGVDPPSACIPGAVASVGSDSHPASVSPAAQSHPARRIRVAGNCIDLFSRMGLRPLKSRGVKWIRRPQDAA